MPIFSIHQSLNSFISINFPEIERLCFIANIFSSGVVVLHADALGKKLFDDDFTSRLKILQKKHHVIFSIENIAKTAYGLSKNYSFKSKEFANAVNNAGFAMTFDIAHLAQAGYDVIEFYLANKEKIINIHLSDYKANWLNKKLLLHSYTHLSLSKGELPIQEFLTTLKKTHYNGLITMEIIKTDLKSLCESARMIKKYMS